MTEALDSANTANSRQEHPQPGSRVLTSVAGFILAGLLANKGLLVLTATRRIPSLRILKPNFHSLRPYRVPWPGSFPASEEAMSRRYLDLRSLISFGSLT
jgi:hypothetical protein